MKVTLNLSLASIFLSCAVLPTPAFSYWECPVGVDPNGPNNTGVACVWLEDYEEEEVESSAYESELTPQYPRYSMEDIEAVIAEPSAEGDMQQGANIGRPQVVGQGKWKVFQSLPQDAKLFCQANFPINTSSGVLLMATDQAALMGFYGGAIPSTSANQNIKLSLRQSGETQTVQAIHLPYMWDKSKGMYLFTIPSPQALLAAIEDQQDFAVMFKGKTMLQGEWDDGNAARAWLSSCMDKHG